MTLAERDDTWVNEDVAEPVDADDGPGWQRLSEWAVRQIAGARTADARGYWRGLAVAYQEFAELASGGNDLPYDGASGPGSI